jgi:heavy metal sensor kinase
MKRQSIRFRLTAWYAMALLLGLGALSVVVWVMLRHELYSELDALLWNQARGMAMYMQVEQGDGQPSLRDEIGEYVNSLPFDHLSAVVDPRGRMIYSSGFPPEKLDHALLAGILANQWGTVRLKHKRYRTLDYKVRLRDGNYTLIIAASTRQIGHTLEQLAIVLWTTVPLIALCGIGGGYWLSRRALAPVDEVTRKARFIGIENLSERLDVPKTNDELERLAETWNEMLGRLEIAVSRISQFTADASHELRTPIAIIRSTAEIVLRKRRSETEYREALAQIEHESQEMTKLVEDLLFLARNEARGAVYPTHTLELKKLVTQICSEMQPIASAKRIQLNWTSCMEEVPMVGVESQLRRMVLALLDNALKYTPAGGSIEVSLRLTDGAARLQVKDTGIGIPEEARGHIFERFYRADPSRSRESGGYGLGLSIAQAIARQHGALIETKPGVDGGSIFWLELPVGNALKSECPV